MSSTVLGKRSRGAADEAEPASSRITRSKRQAIVVEENDENENPFVTRKTRKASSNATKTRAEDIIRVRPSKPPTPAPSPKKIDVLEVPTTISPSKAIKASFGIFTDENSFVHPPTPQTPRHRDALSKKVPITPRHRVGIVGKPLTPRTPRTPGTPSNSQPTVYNEARQAFTRSSNNGRLFGRESEKQELGDFISKRLEAKTPGCMYISGPPGTGKSAFVNEVCRSYEGQSSVRRAYVNCMSAKNETDIYRKLLEELGEEEVITEAASVLEQLFHSTDYSYLVVLDEVDHLLEIEPELLYSFFDCAFQPNSRLVLIGIANALDLTDRFLPKLKSRGLKPDLLPFLPYTAPQIASVITGRLKDLLPNDTTALPSFVPFLDPAAVQFCAKKVAAQTGDLRKAFDIVRRAIDIIEAETKAKHSANASDALQASPSKTPLVENMNLSSPPATRSPLKAASKPTSTDTLQQLTAETAPRATIAHIARITATVFGHGTTQRLKTLNLQQKAVLCALSALERRNRSSPTASNIFTPSKKDTSAPTIKQLYETYTSLCKRENILHPLTNTEFRDIITSLETLGLLAPVDGKGGKGSFSVPGTPSKRGRGSGFGKQGLVDEKRVASAVGEKELDALLEDKGGEVLRGILEGRNL